MDRHLIVKKCLSNLLPKEISKFLLKKRTALGNHDKTIDRETMDRHLPLVILKRQNFWSIWQKIATD